MMLHFGKETYLRKMEGHTTLGIMTIKKSFKTL